MFCFHYSSPFTFSLATETKRFIQQFTYTVARFPSSRLRRKAFLLMSRPNVDGYFYFCLLCCVIAVACTHANQSQSWSVSIGAHCPIRLTLADTIYFAYVAIYVVELTLRFLAGGSSFFRNSVNILDFVLLLGSLGISLAAIAVPTAYLDSPSAAIATGDTSLAQRAFFVIRSLISLRLLIRSRTIRHALHTL